MNLAPLNAAAVNGYFAAPALLRGLLAQTQSLSGLARWGLLASTSPMTMVQTISGTLEVTHNLMPAASLTVRQSLRGNAGSFSYVPAAFGAKLARDIQLQVRP